MKKIISEFAIVAAIFGIVSVAPAQAEEKSIVIIDSYFDKSRINGNFTIVCLATDSCVNTANRSTNLTDPAEHGTLMANMAYRQNPNAKLILIQTENVVSGKVGLLGGNDFLKAITWVNNNFSNVLSVSFSYTLSGNTTASNPCALSTADGTNVRVVDPAIRSVVSQLKSKGVSVFAAAGNDTRRPVAYPACIEDVVSVGVKAGGVKISRYYSDQVDLVSNLVSGIAPLQFTTSVGNVVAATVGTQTSGQLDVVLK